MEKNNENETVEKVAGAPATATVSSITPTPSETRSTTIGGTAGLTVSREGHSVDGLPPVQADAKVAVDGVGVSQEADSLKAELAALRAELEQAKEGNKVAETLDEKVAALSEKVGKQKVAARSRVLEAMGVKAHLMKYAPDVDVDTVDGVSELQKWAEQHPELVGSAKADESPTFTPEQLTKQFKSPHLINVSLLRGKKK